LEGGVGVIFDGNSLLFGDSVIYFGVLERVLKGYFGIFSLIQHLKQSQI
jgi:hypothetical protein